MTAAAVVVVPFECFVGLNNCFIFSFLDYTIVCSSKKGSEYCHYSITKCCSFCTNWTNKLCCCYVFLSVRPQKSCPKSKKSPNLVTLVPVNSSQGEFLPFWKSSSAGNEVLMSFCFSFCFSKTFRPNFEEEKIILRFSV